MNVDTIECDFDDKEEVTVNGFTYTEEEQDVEVDGQIRKANSLDTEASEKLIQLPINRIKKIMKMDPDVHIASQEAVFLIAKATELFLDSVSREAYSFTASDNKKTVTKKHLESAINNIDALAFLDGVLDCT